MADEEVATGTRIARLTEFAMRFRAIVHDTADKLIKFCELLALTAAFHFVHVKTKNDTFGMLVTVLKLIVVIYVVEGLTFIFRNNFEMARRKSWGRYIFIAFFAVTFSVAIYTRSREMLDAIALMATNQ
jgi:hypothetical protein